MLAIYTRLSRDDEASNSIRNQLREGEQFAKEINLDFKHYDEGEGISGGADIENRPALKELMTDIEDGKITSVWFRNQNRLERSSLTYAQFATLVKTMGTKVYFGDKLQDFKDPSSNLQGTVLSALNQYQRELQSKQTQRALLDNVRAGKAHGILPYGYKTDKNGLLVINEDEAKDVRKIFELSLNGKGTNKIAELFNEWGVSTRLNNYKGTFKLPSGKKVPKSSLRWAGNTIRSIIINPIYKGERRWRTKKKDSMVFQCPAIFDEDYWKKANDNLKKNRNNSGKQVIHKYLLKGFIKCGRCGRNYYGRSRVSKNDNYYMCSSKRYKHENCGNRSINIDFLEDFIWKHFGGGDYEDILRHRLEQIKNSDMVKDLDKEISAVMSELAALRKGKRNLILAVENGAVELEDVSPRMTSIKTEIKDKEGVLRNLNEQVVDYKGMDENTLLDELNSFRILDVNFNDKKEMLKNYLDKIIIYFDEEIQHYFIEINSKIANIKYVYLAPYNKSYAYLMNRGGYEPLWNMHFYAPVNWQQVNIKFIKDATQRYDNLKTQRLR